MNSQVFVKLGDIVNINSMTYSPKKSWKFVNYLDTGNICENAINNICFINTSKDNLPSRARRIVKYNSIIYSTVRPNQKHYGIIKNQPPNFLVSTGFAVIDVDAKKADADFVYFFLSQNYVVEKLHAIAEQSTTAYPSINPADIENLQINLPSIDTQKKIGGLLKNIMDKISINNHINDNLSAQSKMVA